MSSGRLLLPLLSAIREAHPPREGQALSPLTGPLAGLTLIRDELRSDAVYLHDAFSTITRQGSSQADQAVAGLFLAASEILAAAGRPTSGIDRDEAYVRGWVSLLQAGIVALSTPEATAFLASIHPPSEPSLGGPHVPQEGEAEELEEPEEPKACREPLDPSLPGAAPFPTLPREVQILHTTNPYGPQAGAVLFLAQTRVRDTETGEITDLPLLVAHTRISPDAQW